MNKCRNPNVFQVVEIENDSLQVFFSWESMDGDGMYGIQENKGFNFNIKHSEMRWLLFGLFLKPMSICSNISEIWG